MNLEELEKIIALLKDTDITELELEKEGSALRIRRGSHAQIVRAADHQNQGDESVGVELPSGEGGDEVRSKDEEAAESELVKIESPIVGTFYRKPSPDSEAFVEVGSRVKKGDRLCIVEAMKLMNEIESSLDGTVEKILLKDGEVVEFGETLFLIRPDS
ncbi:MAG: acetyl-CoA carboxylase biotin carboxyl carrier protein [Deltaproteobacteria bacterium]|nr:acetyl-CoA carboxylase biotin carboxyl carrier protein [Deltaproteobacteria bacterium]